MDDATTRRAVTFDDCAHVEPSGRLGGKHRNERLAREFTREHDALLVPARKGF